MSVPSSGPERPLAPAPGPTETPWDRLSGRAAISGLPKILFSLVPLTVALLLARQTPTFEVWYSGATITLGFLTVTISQVLSVLTIRFRVTRSNLEVTRGLLVKKRTTIARSRIRTLATSASLIQRGLGISTVRISAAGGDSVDLPGVTEATVKRLRHSLRAGEAVGQAVATAAPADPSVPERFDSLATFDWRWIRFAPLSTLGLAGSVAVLGAAWSSARSLGINPESVLEDAGRAALNLSVWAVVAAGVGLLFCVGIAVPLVMFSLRWYGLKLELSERGLASSRGALTQRTRSVRRQRIVGIEVIDTALTRLGSAARLEVLAADRAEDKHGPDLRALTPAIERPAAVAISHAVLGEPIPAAATLLPRPLAALRRRQFRAGLVSAALSPGVIFGAVWAALGETEWRIAVPIGAAWLALTALAFLYAHRAYAQLGHRLTGSVLAARQGVLVTRLTVVHRERIIGIATRQTWFQRRRDLVTLVAVIPAAGSTGIVLRDLAVGTAQDLGSALLSELRDEARPGAWG